MTLPPGHAFGGLPARAAGAIGALDDEFAE
jgi:hypothetical protein